MIRTPGLLAIAGLVAAGGLTRQAPAICALPIYLPSVAFARFADTQAATSAPAPAQKPSTPAETARPAVTLEALQDAINHLGAFDDATRVKSAQVVRRAQGQMAVVSLLQAAREHADGYVRYRALVLLSGYNDPRVAEEMERALAEPNDRLRSVAYEYFEHHPSPALLPTLLTALTKETAEFVRPSLVRALAAQGSDPRVQQVLLKDVMSGQDFFRSTVIEALGDYKASYAGKALTQIASLDGPLQDDATLALGKIGDKSALGVLAGLQRTASREHQPLIAAGICLLGVNCDTHRGYLMRTLSFADKTIGYQELLRGAASGLGAMATAGDQTALDALFDIGIPAEDPARAPIALALASVAVRQPMVVVGRLAERPDRAPAIALLRDGFDMLEEDYGEEQFFVTVRRAYFTAPANSPTRPVIQALITSFEF